MKNHKITHGIASLLEDFIEEFPGSRNALLPIITKLNRGITLTQSDKDQINYWIEWYTDQKE